MIEPRGTALVVTTTAAGNVTCATVNAAGPLSPTTSALGACQSRERRRWLAPDARRTNGLGYACQIDVDFQDYRMTRVGILRIGPDLSLNGR